MLPHRRVYDEEHNHFRETVRRFTAAKIAPNFQRWEEAGIIDRSLLNAGGTAGLLCPQVPEEFGGAGGDFQHNAVVIEELSYSGFAGPATDFSVHNDVCCGYLLSYGTPEQKQKWLSAHRLGRNHLCHRDDRTRHWKRPAGHPHPRRTRGDEYVISGQKTFITNGQMCDLIIVVVRTAPRVVRGE